jgi:hypothetical protein
MKGLRLRVGGKERGAAFAQLNCVDTSGQMVPARLRGSELS